MSFKKATFHLTEPICHCRAQNLTWYIFIVDGRPWLVIHCRTCFTEFTVPPENFIAEFTFSRPYSEYAVEHTESLSSKGDVNLKDRAIRDASTNSGALMPYPKDESKYKVAHNRNFTEFDKKFLEKLKIPPEGKWPGDDKKKI